MTLINTSNPFQGYEPLPPPQAKTGCSEHFTQCLQKIKEWVCTFFRYLFCCSPSEPSPLKRSITVQEPESPTQTISDEVAAEEPAKEPRLPQKDQGIMIQTLFCGRMKKLTTASSADKVKILSVSGLALLRGLNPLTQLAMLHEWATFNLIKDWTPFIQALPSAIQEKIDPSRPDFNSVFGLANKDLPPEKLFLHEILCNAFMPLESQKRFSSGDLEEFVTFTPEQQFFIIYTLLALGTNDPHLDTRLNYTEIGKLLNHSKIKAAVYAAIKAKPRVEANQFELLPTFDNVNFFISNPTDLNRFFQVFLAMAEQAPWKNALISQSEEASSRQPVVPVDSAPTVPLPAIKVKESAHPVPENARAFIGQYFTILTGTAQNVSNLLHVRIITSLSKTEDQILFLQNLAQTDRINNWCAVIDILPTDLQKIVYLQLSTQEQVREEACYTQIDKRTSLKTMYSSNEIFKPVFDTLVNQPFSHPVSPAEQFLEDLILRIFTSGKDYLTPENCKRFTDFSQQQQAFILFHLDQIILGTKSDCLEHLFTLGSTELNLLFNVSSLKREWNTSEEAIDTSKFGTAQQVQLLTFLYDNAQGK